MSSSGADKAWSPYPPIRSSTRASCRASSTRSSRSSRRRRSPLRRPVNSMLGMAARQRSRAMGMALPAVRSVALCFLLVARAGCANYRSQPLGTASTLPERIPDLLIDPRLMPLPEMATHRFDPADGLDMTEVAMLAVVNHPDLKIARAMGGVAHAQAFAAGLLPDPRLGAALDVPDRGQTATTTAYNFGLSYDVMSLLTRAPRYSAARQDARKTDLNILWQEWLVVAMARQLFVRLTQERQLMEGLGETRRLFADRYRLTETGLARGLLD